eukprot:EG_transcript_6024
MMALRRAVPAMAWRRGTYSTRLDFNDPSVAYRPKTTAELARALVIFKLCAQPWLVQNADRLLQLSSRLVGESLTHAVVRRSFFAHFCAGEDEKDIRPVLQKLEEAGVGAILDYAAEKDIEDEDTATRRSDVVEVTGAIQSYVGEEDCDANMDLVLSCIQTASQARTDGIAAIKLTGLGKPRMLLRVSRILLGVRKLWLAAFTQAPIEDVPEEELRFAVSRTDSLIDLAQFKASLARAGVRLPDADVEQIFTKFDVSGDGFIDYLEWTGRLTLEELRQDPPPEEAQRPVHQLVVQLANRFGVQLLTKEEYQLTENMVRRLQKICQAASDKKVRLLIDAEQTYLQVAIDHFTTRMQREFNAHFPTVFNTYQCYLNFTRNRITNDLERSKREGWIFAGKLVRGAYMVQERKLSVDKHYHSPIFDTIEATHENYNTCLKLVFDAIDRAEVVIATHNQRSIELAVETMDQLQVDRRTRGVYFAQLLGMADNLSFTLGQAGYKVFKYVPYGPVGLVMPYLLRRAQENGDALSGAQQEVHMLWRELKRRQFRP